MSAPGLARRIPCSLCSTHVDEEKPPGQKQRKAEAERLFAALADDGQVQMLLTTTVFAPYFGRVADRCSVSWRGTVAP